MLTKSFSLHVLYDHTAPLTICSQNHFCHRNLRIPDCHLLVINTYFPCDPRSASSDFIELTELLGDLESLISNVEFTNILISGDLNCHFQRNSKFTTIIKHWLDEYNLQVLWSLDDDRIEPC